MNIFKSFIQQAIPIPTFFLAILGFASAAEERRMPNQLVFTKTFGLSFKRTATVATNQPRPKANTS